MVGEFQVSAPPDQKGMLNELDEGRHRVAVLVVHANAHRVVRVRMTVAYIAIGSNLASPLEQVMLP